jgi:hypothetical protein
MAVVRVSDVVVPEIFNGYAQQLTMELSALVQSGAVVSDAVLASNLAGAGLTFNEPSFKDVTNEDENISSDDPTTLSTPKNIGSLTEIQVRLSRNQSWSSMDLAGDLIARDPMDAMARRVGHYWALRLQAAFVATMKGVFADNAAAPAGADTHLQNDLTVDIKGGAFADGVTNFSAEAFIDACVTMGDAMGGLRMICVHSIVYARMQKNNLIDFIPDSEGNINIPTFLGRRVVVDDAMPATAGVFESWLFGPGVVRLGMGSPKVPVEVERVAAAGNGSGQETLHSRVEMCLHPKGHAYIGTAPNGGPSNAATANNLAHLDSWRRVWPERKQIKMARLITREF